MKKSLVLLGCAFVLATLVGCGTTKVESKAAESRGETKVEKEFEFIKNGYAVDCPDNVKEKRLELLYGTLKHETYFSNTCQRTRGFTIMLPQSYDGEKKYPVVYFQHGIFGDENCMVYDQKNAFREIATNLAADGDAPEMIFVFGNMYASSDPNQKPSFKPEDVLPYDNFINELINDLMPYIESHYSVLTGRENTAVCGFSMGGRESLYIGFKRPDLFGYIGAISPAPGLVPARDWAMQHEGQMPEEELCFKEGDPLPKVLMVTCGTQDSVVGQFPKSYHKLLEKNGVEHTWFESLNADHNDQAIRCGLYYFIKNIF
ncbi:alpha/beta hydrolase [Treponema sp.]|uniref:alpha/beta hydrolase n=1 Tax=Treponema sp. TaxID=166 RepID=UPI00298ECB3C|nr:alpha/beta hydrolase-fold protein [Treponema sp.]MCQ2242330.1 esterase family protein [Treponema sp.]